MEEDKEGEEEEERRGWTAPIVADLSRVPCVSTLALFLAARVSLTAALSGLLKVKEDVPLEVEGANFQRKKRKEEVRIRRID